MRSRYGMALPAGGMALAWASVAGALIESLEGPAEPGVEEAWSEEIRRRVEALEAGTVKTLPWSEVRERLFRGFE